MMRMAKGYAREKPVQSVTRTLRILEVMAERGSPMCLSEISNELNLNISTVHRLLKTLIMHGFAQKDPYTGRYLLGIKNFSIGNTALYTLDIRAVAKPFLKTLQSKYKETVSLAIMDQGDVIYIDQVESEKMMKATNRLGTRSPAHCNAVGKVLLANMSDVELDALLKGKKLQRYTCNTIVSLKELKEELEKIKRDGYALEFEESEEGIRCVAAPIFDYIGKPVAAIGISGPVNRISKVFLEGELAVAVKHAARGISSSLGSLGDRV